jgi:hypothetical protein
VLGIFRIPKKAVFLESVKRKSEELILLFCLISTEQNL